MTQTEILHKNRREGETLTQVKHRLRVEALTPPKKKRKPRKKKSAE